jgi:hypothetical protein
MAWETRIALDFMLAENVGVCKMLEFCAAHVYQNNSAHDGPITKALQGLTSLSKELAEISDINDLFIDLLKNCLGDGRVE